MAEEQTTGRQPCRLTPTATSRGTGHVNASFTPSVHARGNSNDVNRIDLCKKERASLGCSVILEMGVWAQPRGGNTSWLRDWERLAPAPLLLVFCWIDLMG